MSIKVQRDVCTKRSRAVSEGITCLRFRVSCKGDIIVLRFIIEYSSRLRDFGPLLGKNIRSIFI